MTRRHRRSVATFLFLCWSAVLSPAAFDAPAPEAGSSVEMIGPQVILESQKPPEYPPAAKAGRFNGSVMLEITVLPDGKVGKVDVLDCTRPKVGFENAARDAVKKWRFEPGTRDGEPVEFSLKFRLNFNAGKVGGSPRVSAGSFTAASPPVTAPEASRPSK